MTASSDTFFDTTFADTLQLVEECRNLILQPAKLEGDHVSDPVARVMVTRELSRLTNRAAATMSLLLLYKALKDGQAQEIDDPQRRLVELHAEALPKATPSERLVNVELPPVLRGLLDQAEEVFRRMDRLREMIESHLATGSPSGARSAL